jgi:hypothetical protein
MIVLTFFLTLQTFTMFRQNARDKTFTGAWAAYRGAHRSNDSRILTICFSRLRVSKSMTTGQDQSEGECLQMLSSNER